MSSRPSLHGASAWLALALTLAAFLALTLSGDPARRFGGYHDDAIYFSVGAAIADGRGPVMPSVPGSPLQSKYAPLYPYVLSLIWRAFPSFPENLGPAIALTALFGAAALALAFGLLRRWRGLPAGTPLVAVAWCATLPLYILASGALLSDVVFFAFALAALLAADSADSRPGKSVAWAVVFCLLATFTRTIGVALAAGLASYFVYRREWRRAMPIALSALPALIRGVFVRFVEPFRLTDTDPPGFRQTWAYYTDYAAFWKLSTPDLNTFLAMISANLGDLLQTPAALVFGPAPPGTIGTLTWITLTCGIVAGLVRQAQADRLRPIHVVLPVYASIVLMWNFQIADRLLLGFAPIFAAGFAMEARHALGGFWRTARFGPDRAVSAVLLVLSVALLGYLGVRGYAGRLAILGPSTQPDLHGRYAELFDWMRANTRADERFVAIDDVFAYLHTGRQGLWPLALTTEPRYRPDAARLAEQLDRLSDVARRIDARYMIVADHDYAFSGEAQRRLHEGAAALPEVARSADGSAKIVDLSCVLAQDWANCPEAQTAWTGKSSSSGSGSRD